MNSPGKQFYNRDFFLRSWHPYLWIVLVASLPYLQILTFSEYTHYDDYFLIVESYSHIEKLSNIGHAFLEDVSHQAQGGNLYRPMMTISLILSAQISGIMPFGYHLIDIILHCASCVLLFVVLQMLGFKRSVSFLGTLVFCIHPALTQAVAWIAGRNDSLLAIFVLLCFISFIKFLSTSHIKWYFFHLIFFMLAMLTKETSIVFPVLALLYFYNTLGRGIISITTLLFFVGWGIVLFNWYILRSAAMIAPVGNMLQVFVSVLSNIPLALCYLGNIFWPIDIAYAPIPSDIHIASGIVSAGSILLAIFLSERKDWKIIIFGVMWFLVFLLPTLYYKTGVLAPPKFFEHRIYLPFMGIIFMLLSLSYSNKLEYFKRLSLPIYFLGTVFLGWLSYTHTLNFKNYFTLSEYDASTSPNDLRRYNDITRMNIPLKLNNEMIAVKGELQLQESKRTPITKEGLWKIIDDLKNEIKVNGNDAKLHHALAIAYFARGLLFSSEKNFFTALQEEPQNAIVPYNLGILYYSSYEGTKAEKAWQEALRLDPSMGNAHLNLSFLYYEEGQYRSAWDHCQKAMQLGTTIPVGLAEEIRRNDSY